MSYSPLTTAAKIQAYFPGVTFSATTKPTQAEVENWILQATGVIYGAINEQYVVPVTDTDDLLQLEMLADEYVCVNVRSALGRTQLREVSGGQMMPVQPSHKLFYETLRKYQEGCLVLPNSLASSLVETASYNSANGICSVSKKNEVQW